MSEERLLGMGWAKKEDTDPPTYTPPLVYVTELLNKGVSQEDALTINDILEPPTQDVL